MYKLYRTIVVTTVGHENIRWKYTDSFNSTLDSRYHELINIIVEHHGDWILIDDVTKRVKFSSQPNFVGFTFDGTHLK